MLWDYVGWDNPVVKVIYYTVRDELPRAVLALAVIWVGVRLLRGKSEIEEPDTNRKEQAVETPVMQIEQRKEQAEDGQKDEQQDGQTDGQREA